MENSTPSNFLFFNGLFPITTTQAPSIFEWFIGGTRTTTKAPVQALFEPFSTLLKSSSGGDIKTQTNSLIDNKLINGGGATEIDTGGPNTFDRIVIREKQSKDSTDVNGLFSNILGSENFNEKGNFFEFIN